MRYYITDRRLGWHVWSAIRTGVEYIQIREKDLDTRELYRLTCEAVDAARGTITRILVNGRADIAAAAGAHGVHLPAGAPEARLFKSLLDIVAVSCHTKAEIERAEAEGADFAVFGPVFDTPGKGPALGLNALEEACRAVRMPVFALGGITEANAAECLAHGAAGIAGIRLFSER